MNHLLQLTRLNSIEQARRGFSGQRRQREIEQAARRFVVDVSTEIVAQGWNLSSTADFLDLSPRTLRHWRHVTEHSSLLQPLGRPAQRSPRQQRNEVIHLIDELGPGIGLPTLCDCFPHMARAELEDLLKRYRRLWRRQNQQPLRVLHWTTPGSVWAIDFSEPEQPIDGRYPYLLAVRDLATGYQLLWQPVRKDTSLEAAVALAPLMVTCGAPLVLKSDNGSAFGADPFQALLRQFGVCSLFSPAYTPEYNGTIEAGNGSLKNRTENHASRQGHPGYWTYDDVAAARAEANTTARPHGPNGPSPQQAWLGRRRLGPLDRALFQDTVERLQPEARRAQEQPDIGPLTLKAQRAVDRVAIRRALEEHGYLLYARRSIPLIIRKQKAARIT